MMLKKVPLALGAAFAASALMLTSCSASTGEANGQITLEFPTWQGEDPAFAPWWNELIAAYEEEHDGVSIDFYQIPFDSYVDQMTTRFAAGDNPDIVQLPARNASEFASRGWLEPLDDRLADTDIVESWTPLQEEMALEGKTYGVLLLGYGYVMYYNQGLLDDAGVQVPTTADELVQAATAVTDGEVYGFGATTQQGPDNYTELMSFIVGNGTTLADEDGNFQADSPSVVEALQQYRDALSNAPAGIQSQQRNELFLSGKIAMLLDGPFFLPELESAAAGVKENLKVTAPPFGVVPGGVSNSIHMPAGLDKAKEEAVWDFIELAASPKWQQRYAALTAVPAPREGSVTAEALTQYPQLELFQSLVEDAHTIYPTDPEQRKSFSRLSEIVSQAAIKLISSDKPTPEIAAELQQDLERSELGS